VPGDLEGLSAELGQEVAEAAPRTDDDDDEDERDEAQAGGGSGMDDQWRLERFVTAQERGGTYQEAVAELRAGAKVSHWMWFVFPQVAGLGRSAMSREYAISSVAEARAYLAHPVLGPRLRECARIVAGTEGGTAEGIFGPVDAVKLRSSMTLFAAAETGEAGSNVFRAVLARYYGGVPDEATVSRLLRRNNASEHSRVQDLVRPPR
jgi:uncharacterized protein (DUF1810 family)